MFNFFCLKLKYFDNLFEMIIILVYNFKKKIVIKKNNLKHDGSMSYAVSKYF